MAILWSLGGVKIAVEKDSGDTVTPRLDEINPLGSALTTYLHYAGTEAKKRSITGVLFENYESAFIALIDGTAKALVSDQGAEGNYVILSLKPERVQDTKRDLPVTRVDIDLMKA